MKFAVLDDAHHAGALVQADVVLGAHVDDAVGHGQVLGLFQGRAQGGAELRGAGLGGFEGAYCGSVQQRIDAPGVAGELGDAARAIAGFIARDKIQRRLFDRVVGGQVVGDHHGLGGEDGAFDVLAAQADKFGGGDAVGLVDGAAVAAFDQGALRQHGWGAGTGDQDGVGVSFDQFEGLAGDAGVGAVEAFGGDDADMAQFGEFGKLLQPAFAITVGEADKADGFNVVVGHVTGYGVGHGGVVLRHFEGPDAFALLRLDHLGGADQGDHRRAAFGCGVEGGHGRGGGVGADDDVNLVFRDKFTHIAHGRAGVRGVVEDDVLGRAAGQRGGPHQHGVFAGDADGGGWSRGRKVDADLDRGVCGSGGMRDGDG